MARLRSGVHIPYLTSLSLSRVHWPVNCMQFQNTPSMGPLSFPSPTGTLRIVLTTYSGLVILQKVRCNWPSHLGCHLTDVIPHGGNLRDVLLQQVIPLEIIPQATIPQKVVLIQAIPLGRYTRGHLGSLRAVGYSS